MLTGTRTLTIAIKSDRYASGLEEVPGHCCSTDDEVLEYVKTLEGSLRVVPIGFEFGEIMHEHTDECWEPDSGCDMGRNEKYVQVVKWPDNGTIVAAAIKKGDEVWALPKPCRHHDVIEFLVDFLDHPAPIGPGQGYIQGFIDNSGQFLTREQAAAAVGKPGKLFSEDLW